MALAPTLEEIGRYTARMRQLPDLCWVGVVVLLGMIAGRHAIERQRRERTADSEERGWQFSADWSPIREEDWQQLRQNPDFAYLAFPQNRKDFSWGTHLGTVFVMFQQGASVMLDAETGVPETVIAFKRPVDSPIVQSTIAGGGVRTGSDSLRITGFSCGRIPRSGSCAAPRLKGSSKRRIRSAARHLSSP
jgi:hypothetical protein